MRLATKFGAGLLAIASSLGTSCVLLALLGLLTWLGTLEQTRSGLFEVQRRYFESFVLLHDFGPFSLPLPGANLVMCLLFVNLLLGGIVKLRKDASTFGILVAHLGIALLFVAAFVKHRYSQDGQLTLYEGQKAAHFESWFRWELVLIEDRGDGRAREHRVRHEDVVAAEDGPVRVVSNELPVALEIERAWSNCRPRLAGAESDDWTLDGVRLETVPDDTRAEANIAGACVAVVDPTNGLRRRALVWGAETGPAPLFVAGRTWLLELRKERYEMPFTVALQKFEKIDHPRSDMPRSFASDVRVSTGVEAASARDVRISMNEPLRDGGLVVYQASWGPSNARPGQRLFSTFAVVRNPADAWPLIACLVVALGLTWHFVRKLGRHVRSEGRGA